jgi:hypothetical protein
VIEEVCFLDLILPWNNLASLFWSCHPFLSNVCCVHTWAVPGPMWVQTPQIAAAVTHLPTAWCSSLIIVYLCCRAPAETCRKGPVCRDVLPVCFYFRWIRHFDPFKDSIETWRVSCSPPSSTFFWFF